MMGYYTTRTAVSLEVQVIFQIVRPFESIIASNNDNIIVVVILNYHQWVKQLSQQDIIRFVTLHIP